jgi:hypothetical protein
LPSRLKIRGVWSSPEAAGRTRDEVWDFAARLAGSNINLLVMMVKGARGELFWPSSALPHSVADGYVDFDFPRHLLEACNEHGIALHAWFIDFMEGKEGAAFREHPEWAARDPRGETTAGEGLRGKPYHSVWMCPARRPGYADGWLIPAMREFAERYDCEAIHHDYIRYPGDLAPDRYCFCDDCLEQIPRFAGYRSDQYPDEPFYHDTYNRPYLEAHWERSPRVLPGNWDILPREMKSRFLLEGSYFQGGRPDLDYFFYLYRTDSIHRFARDSAAAIRSARPGMKISAAVFKDSVQSGRFIGQDWRTFGDAVDHLMPMDYRDHYPGDFDTHLNLLAESIEKQKVWASDAEALWPGIAINFLYREEIDQGLEPAEVTPEKLLRTIDRVRATGVEGICLFSEGQVTRYGLWDAVRDAFRG